MFTVTLLILTRYPYDWTYTAGEAFVRFAQGGGSPLFLRESWYAIAFVIFLVFSFLSFLFGRNFINHSPTYTKRQGYLEFILLTMVGTSPLTLLGRSGILLDWFAKSQPAYWSIDAGDSDPLRFFLHQSPDLLNASRVLSIGYALLFFFVTVRSGYASELPETFARWATSLRIPSVIRRPIYWLLGRITKPSNRSVPTYGLIRVLLITYAASFFLGFFIMNTYTILNPKFSWLGPFDSSWSIYSQSSSYSLGYWYIIALAIFILGSIAVFILFFLFRWSKRQRETNRRVLAFEVFLVTIIALSPFALLHTSRLFLDFFPIVDPEQERQLEYMRSLNVSSWEYRSLPLEQRADSLKLYSGYLLLVYLILFISAYGLVLAASRLKSEAGFTNHQTS
jgi:hypothetical protein